MMRVKAESEKAGLKFNIQKTKIMASDPFTSWQIDGGKGETVIDFILWGPKITADSDCSHEIIKCLLLGRKAMKNLDSVKKAETSLCHIFKAMVFLVVIYECESWTVKKAEH